MRDDPRHSKNTWHKLLGLTVLLLFASNMPALADCDFKQGDAAKGAKVYAGTCVACHGENGHGVVPGAPDFTKKGGVLSKPHSVISKHIKNGFRAPGAPLAMPAKGGNPELSDKDIVNVHAYLHSRFECR